MTPITNLGANELLLKARIVHDRLGDRFYSIFRIILVSLNGNLLVTAVDISRTSEKLHDMGFIQGLDFGISYFNGFEVVAGCNGISFSQESSAWSLDDEWSESHLPPAVREAYYRTEDLIQNAKLASERADFEAVFDAALLERVPLRVIAWARVQRKATHEMIFIRKGVKTLRARKLNEDIIQNALSHPSFSQELIRLLRSSVALG